ncbi:MAG: type II toxin-antitoxin system VapC family toxin [Planctomycetes bacterium]|nr:type II toxin-antitoxin system VapC family toxin [Planctomycetota bacterium]
MRTVFADTGYYIALLNGKDEYHARAVEFTAAFDGAFLTTAWILLELANHLAKTPNRPLFLSLEEDLRKNSRVRILPPTQDDLERGLGLYRRRPDKDWSLTDCISFVAMKEAGLTEALATDGDFTQAGFTVLLT